MKTPSKRTSETESRSVANQETSKTTGTVPSVPFTDKRPETAFQLKLQEIANKNRRTQEYQPPTGRMAARNQPPVQLKLKGKKNILSGKTGLDEKSGRIIMDMLTSGDPKVWELLDAKPEDDPLAEHVLKAGAPTNGADPVTQGREYGLIKDNETGEVHIIVGHTGNVEWGPFLDEGTPLAHSHPLVQESMGRRYDPKPGWSIRGGGENKLSDIRKNPVLYGTYLPSAGDVQFMVAQKVKTHTVFTPYRVAIKDTEPVLVDAVGESENPKFRWELSVAEVKEDKIYGTMTAMAGEKAVWTSGFSIGENERGQNTNFVFGD